MGKQCLQCGYPLKDNDLPLCPSCNLKTMQKIQLDRTLGKKQFNSMGILFWCVIGVITFIAAFFVIDYAKSVANNYKLDTLLKEIKSDMQQHAYANAWSNLQKVKALDPANEAIPSLTAALRKEPLEVAENLIWAATSNRCPFLFSHPAY